MSLPDGLLRALGEAVQRAGGTRKDVEDLIAVWQRLDRELDRRASVLAREVRCCRCCCAQPAEPGLDGRCLRCYGSLRKHAGGSGDG
jgi:uncharacterized paraquat-inducible protein A